MVATVSIERSDSACLCPRHFDTERTRRTFPGGEELPAQIDVLEAALLVNRAFDRVEVDVVAVTR
jgi:hypothetical protein